MFIYLWWGGEGREQADRIPSRLPTLPAGNRKVTSKEKSQEDKEHCQTERHKNGREKPGQTFYFLTRETDSTSAHCYEYDMTLLILFLFLHYPL